MALGPNTTRNFHRKLYPGLRTIILHKRGRGSAQSTGTNYILFMVRQKRIHYGGQNVDGNMNTNDYCEWMIAREELDRVGVDDINIIDTITDVKTGEIWQPESSDILENKLWRNYLNIPTKRIA